MPSGSWVSSSLPLWNALFSFMSFMAIKIIYSLMAIKIWIKSYTGILCSCSI